MILTVAVLLLHFPAIPQNLNLKAFANTAETSDTAQSNTAAKVVGSNAPEPSVNAAPSCETLAAEGLILNSNLPARDSRAAALSLSPRFGLQDRSGRHRRREWLALSIAQHGAATFDAWSTRRAISTGQYQELNPALRPFVGNSSLYAAIQVGPLVLDFLGRHMMTSQHPWLRHTWWLPQTLSTAMSLAGGAHNLTAR